MYQLTLMVSFFQFFSVSDSVLIGHSESFSCTDDVMDTSTPNIEFSGQARSVRYTRLFIDA